METSASTVGPLEPKSHLITAPQAAELVRYALVVGRPDLAVRRLTEAVARLIESQGPDQPANILAEPRTTGDRRYETVLRTAFRYAAGLCRIEAPTWTDAVPLGREWLWGGDGYESEQYKNFIRSQTSAEFLERNILTRARDWVNA